MLRRCLESERDQPASQSLPTPSTPLAPRASWGSSPQKHSCSAGMACMRMAAVLWLVAVIAPCVPSPGCARAASQRRQLSRTRRCILAAPSAACHVHYGKPD